MAKVLVSDKLASEGIEILKNSGFEVDCKYGLIPEELKNIIGNYEALIIRSQTKVTQDIIAAADRLKVIGRAGVGLDNVDIEAATKKGIIVMNAPGGNTISTCEHTFALLLSLARNVPFAYNSLKNKEWNRAKFKGIELYGKTIGIVGLGRIGKEVAKRALAFGMDVIAYDPFINEEIAAKLGVKLMSVKELAKNADIITVHTPLTEQTKYLIAEEEFSLMKPNALILNCARGGIIKEEALYQALKEKKIKAAALDVYEQEPPENSKLLDLDNIIVTPHLGASTQEAQVNVAVEISHCVKDALAGRAIRNAVNFVQLDPEAYRQLQPYINLAEKMGKFIAQWVQGRTNKITINYVGEISSFKVDPLTMALLKGYLSFVMEEDVNFINSLDLAKERGVKIEQVKVAQEEDFVNAIRVEVQTDKERKLLAGTLFANKEPRFVKMDDFYLEVYPSQYMLVISNWDKPGVIGFLGTTLGEHKINIAGMSLGRRAPKDVVLTILNLDNPLDEKVKEKLQKNPDIVGIKFIKL